MSLSRMTALWMLCHLWLKIESGKSILRILNCGLSAIPRSRQDRRRNTLKGMIPGIADRPQFRMRSIDFPESFPSTYYGVCLAGFWCTGLCIHHGLLSSTQHFPVFWKGVCCSRYLQCLRVYWKWPLLPSGLRNLLVGWWRAYTLFPLCRKKNRRRSANCSLCKYKGGWEMMALYIVLLGVFLAIILLCVLLSVHMAIEVEADYDDFWWIINM